MTRAASLLVLAYGLMLLVVGAIGIFTARFELYRLFGLQLEQAGDPKTLASQYGFLKGVELGAGAFCISLRREILAGGRAATAFTILVAGGVFARGLAWALYGRPAMAFIIFLLLETLVLIVFLLRPKERHA